MTADPKIVEVWFKLMAEAAKGVRDAQEAIQSLAKVLNPADLNRWLLKFSPNLASPTAYQQAEMFEEWLEEWWRMMGVVPRARYLDLLEKHEALRRQLEKAQETIRGMQEALNHKGQQPYAKNLLNLWNGMLEETLKTQADWLKVWKETGQAKEVAGPTDKKESNRS